MMNLLFGAATISCTLLICIISFIADFDNIVKVTIGLFLSIALISVTSLLFAFN